MVSSAFTRATGPSMADSGETCSTTVPRPNGLKIKLLYLTTPPQPRWAVSVQSSLGLAGFHVTLVPETQARVRRELFGKPEHVEAGRMGPGHAGLDPGLVRQQRALHAGAPFTVPANGSNDFGGYNDPKTDALINKFVVASGTPDHERRRRCPRRVPEVARLPRLGGARVLLLVVRPHLRPDQRVAVIVTIAVLIEPIARWASSRLTRPAVSLLEVRDLSVSFPTPDGLVRAVQGVTFSVDVGQTLGIVGESGSGKSVACMTVMGLVQGARTSGKVLFDGQDIVTMREDERRQLRGAKIGIVFQDPLSSLHPLYKVGWQIAEAIRAHERISSGAARARAVDMLELVGIPSPARRADEFPYQYSGGMRQRAMIAMALALQPTLLIADEPTTALDVTVQAQIIELIKGLQAELGMAVIMVTHDLGIVAGLADHVAVMYAGKVVEYAERRHLYYTPAHPYTRGAVGLVADPLSRPGQAGPDRWAAPQPHLPSVGLQLPPALPGRARTLPRRGTSVCGRRRPGAPEGGVLAGPPTRPARSCSGHPEPAAVSQLGPQPPAADPILRLDGLVKWYRSPHSSNRRGLVHAVDGVSLELARGETLGLVGESGCGKSTLARCATRLVDVTAGTVQFEGRDITTLSHRDLRPVRRHLQMIFQDPSGSLNSRRRVGSVIGDPLAIHHIGDKQSRRQRVQQLMELVGLNPEHYNRFPAEFSGGQRQRVGVARALATEPSLLVCDEPVSALDVSVQAQIINLFRDLQDEIGAHVPVHRPRPGRRRARE